MADVQQPNLENIAKAYSSGMYQRPAYVEILSKEQMQERSFPQLLKQRGLEILDGVIGFGAEEAYAEDYSQYRTVDGILAGTPFIPVNKYNFEDEKREGKVLLFHYMNAVHDESSKRFAKVLREIVPEFPQLKFLKYVAFEDGLSGKDYLNRFGFRGAPYLALYEDDKLLFEIKGGPKEGFTEEWVPWLKSKIKEKFR